MGDDTLVEEEEEGITWAAMRKRVALIGDLMGEYHGFPLPLPDMNLILNDSHPARERIRQFERERDGVEIEIVCGGDDVHEDEYVRNTFFSRRTNAEIFIFQRGDKVFHAKRRVSPDQCMERLTLALSTLGACDAWDIAAETAALEKLAGMISTHAMRHYVFTGSFLEKSKKSGVTYLFRRLRPTVAMSSRGTNGQDDRMRCIAVLCMHPLGYYGRTWAGCMVPTDDVIAHLSFMRGDEAKYWSQSNQHQPWHPEAGL